MTRSTVGRAARAHLKRELGREPKAAEVREFLATHEVVGGPTGPEGAHAGPAEGPAEAPEGPKEAPERAHEGAQEGPSGGPEEDTISLVQFPVALPPLPEAGVSPPAEGAPPPKRESLNLTAPPPEILTAGIAAAHEALAKGTGYDGFLLTPRMEQMWNKIAEWAMKNLPMKHWPLIIVGFSLFMSYAAMTAGYVAWRKERKAASPLQAPAGGVNVPEGAML